MKDQREILDKLGISKLNPMQQEAQAAIVDSKEVVLLSPTGTGKTLAFLLPLIDKLDRKNRQIQIIIVVPSRELAIQIEQVVREMGTGHKANAVYGGQSFSKDLTNLKTPPAILIGTPGRLADHLRRHTFNTSAIQTLVLDEFDKSLEVGFESEMKEIIAALIRLEQKVLTSATSTVEIPSFVELRNPVIIDHSDESIDQLSISTVVSPSRDKKLTLLKTLNHIGRTNSAMEDQNLCRA